MQKKIFWSAFVLALSGAMAPGPLLSKTIAESLTKGWLAGPGLMLGHSILEILLVFFLLRGFGKALTRKKVQGFLSVIGGLILFWMGIELFIDIPVFQVSTLYKAGGIEQGWFGLILAGALISLANPYWSLWWGTAGISQMTSGLNLGGWGIVSFTGGHLTADWVWYCFVSSMIAVCRSFLSDIYYRIILGIVAAGILIFAFYFLMQGVKGLVKKEKVSSLNNEQ